MPILCNRYDIFLGFRISGIVPKTRLQKIPDSIDPENHSTINTLFTWKMKSFDEFFWVVYISVYLKHATSRFVGQSGRFRRAIMIHNLSESLNRWL